MNLSELPLSLTTATAAALALPAATHVASWGAYKDSVYEGFHPARQVRTLLLAIIAAVVMLLVATPGTVVASLLPAAGVVYALERLATEWWKSILRVDDQTAYTIPMRLGFRGRPVEDRRTRWAVGSAVLVGMALASWLVSVAQVAAGPWIPAWLVPLTIGGLGGWLTAVGGAWKDAPVEGFSGWKFMRSPAVATAWALPLSLLTHNWVGLVLGAAGLAVASIETYKTFFTGGRAPGKFDGKPVRPLPPALKDRLAAMHAVGWGTFAVVALVQAAVSGWSGHAAGGWVALGLAVVFATAARAVLRAHLRLVNVDPLVSVQDRGACRGTDVALGELEHVAR